MAQRTKHYFEIGMPPVFMLPVIALTIGLTLWFSSSHGNTCTFPDIGTDYSKTLALKEQQTDDRDTDTTELEANDQAVFSFTGDTVLVLSDSDPLSSPPDCYRVLYKNKQGGLQVIDLPEAELIKITADTTGNGEE